MRSKRFSLFCKQGFRDTKAIFCLLGKLPNPHRTLPAASGYASVSDALTAVPAKEKSPVRHEHYTHTAPDIPSSTILFIFSFLLHFLLMQLLFFLLVPFRDFLHSLLCSRPILHFRFDFLLKIPRTPCTDQRAIPQNIVHHLFSKGYSIFFPFPHTNP